MPKNVNVAKKGSNAAKKKPSAPPASRSRMRGQTLGGLRGMQGGMRPGDRMFRAPMPQGGLPMGGGALGGIGDIMRASGGNWGYGGGGGSPYMQARGPYFGPSMGIGGGYGNMYGGPSAGGSPTLAGMQTRAPVAPGWGGGVQSGQPTPQISQPFTPPPSGPQSAPSFGPARQPVPFMPGAGVGQTPQQPFNRGGPMLGQGGMPTY